MVASAALHVYWAIGGTWFLATALNMDVEQIPQNLIALTWLLVAAMIGVAIAALARAEVVKLRLPWWLVAMVVWGTAVLMLAGAVFNALIPRFWDQCVFAPIFLVLALLALFVALPPKDCEEEP
jgi:hypothetical protein